MTLTTTGNINTLDKKAFEELFRTHFTGMCYFARKFIKDTDAAKEIVHDSFISLWDKRDTIDMSKPVKSYLMTSIHNKCLNYIRDNKKFNREVLDFERVNPDSNFELSDKLVESELEEKIKRAIDSLPEKCREVFMLNRFENLKYQEVADKLNISIKTVETQMSKALQVLREKLGEYLTIFLLIISLLASIQLFIYLT